MKCDFKKEGYRIINNGDSFKFEDLLALYAQTYWAKSRSIDVIEKSLKHSLFYGIMNNEKLIGFSRWITDYATYAYLCDVIIDEGHRGKGLGKWMISQALLRPDLSTLRRLSLITKDAQGVYEPLGFKKIEHSERYMEIFRE